MKKLIDMFIQNLYDLYDILNYGFPIYPEHGIRIETPNMRGFVKAVIVIFSLFMIVWCICIKVL